MRWPNKQTVSMCVNKAFIRKKYIRSIDALETTRRTNEKERDKFSSGVRYGFKQRSNGRCNEMQKDNSSVEDTRISRRKAVLSAYSTLSSLCLIKTGSTCSSVSLSLSPFLCSSAQYVYVLANKLAAISTSGTADYMPRSISKATNGKRDELNG